MLKAALLQFNKYDRWVFWALIGLLVISIGLYLYFLSMSVVRVIERRTAESEVSKLAGTISMLESRYALLDKRIDLALAHERGFLDIAVPTYLTSNDVRSTLTLRTELGGE